MRQPMTAAVRHGPSYLLLTPQGGGLWVVHTQMAVVGFVVTSTHKLPSPRIACLVRARMQVLPLQLRSQWCRHPQGLAGGPIGSLRGTLLCCPSGDAAGLKIYDH